NDSKQTIEDFSKWLSKEAKILAAGSSLSASSCVPAPKENLPENKKGKCQVMATGDPAKDEKPINSYAKKCKYCELDGHKIQDCRKFIRKPYEKRIKFIRDNRLCFGCLNYGHGFEQCKSKKPCPISGCTIHHHELAHEPYHDRLDPDEQELT